MIHNYLPSCVFQHLIGIVKIIRMMCAYQTIAKYQISFQFDFTENVQFEHTEVQLYTYFSRNTQLPKFRQLDA